MSMKDRKEVITIKNEYEKGYVFCYKTIKFNGFSFAMEQYRDYVVYVESLHFRFGYLECIFDCIYKERLKVGDILVI